MPEEYLSWTIYNYTLKEKDLFCGLNLVSPTLEYRNPDTDEKFSFRLQIYPRGRNADYLDYVGLYLHYSHQDILDPVYVKFKIWLTAHSAFHMRYREFNFLPDKINGVVAGGFGWHDYIPRELLKSRALSSSNDCLVVNCRLNVRTSHRYDTTNWEIFNDLPYFNNKTNQDISGLNYRNEKDQWSDLKLISGDDLTFHVHKFILASRSSVFKAMLRHEDTRESRSGVIKISDVDGDILAYALEYIYRGQISDINSLNGQDTSNLLFFADKYELVRLKSLCELRLCLILYQGNYEGFHILVSSYDLNLKNLEFALKDFKFCIENINAQALIT